MRIDIAEFFNRGPSCPHMGSVERITLTVMRPKRPSDQKQTGNEQEGFGDIVPHNEEFTPHRFRCQLHLWSVIYSRKNYIRLELVEGGSVSGLVPRSMVPEADRGYWISAINHDVALDGKHIAARMPV
jgi:hypothetical protein